MKAEVERVPPVEVTEYEGDERAPWDRLDGEHPADHALFRGYLNLGPKRTIRDLSDRLPTFGLGTLKLLSKRNSWVARAAEFDALQIRRALDELEGEGVSMRARHAEAARLVFEKAVVAAEMTRPEFMQPRDIPVWLDIAAKLERASRGVGEAAKRIEVTGANGGPIEVANGLAAEDRRALMAAIQEQIASRLSTGELTEADVLDGEVVEDEPGQD